MPHQFQHHYTREEAGRLLPQLRQWLGRLRELRHELERRDRRLGQLMDRGHDAGGPLVNEWVRLMADIRDVFAEFERREIQVKDLERGLLDFPALIGGREVFLCWEEDEDDVEFWHELDGGFAGREKL
ncbi:MAG TPA: DUF2203 domain-containing protein [Verrucomicrobiae bacterium]